MSAGAMAFALVDRFGTDAWDVIHDALPTSFFQDAGPVDAAGVEDILQEVTEPGRSSPHRQVGTDDDVRALYRRLVDEGRAIEGGVNPKILERYQLPDGTSIQLRDDSKSGGLTIDVVARGNGRAIKVHVR